MRTADSRVLGLHMAETMEATAEFALVERVVGSFAQPGPTLTGRQRRRLAEVVRNAMAGSAAETSAAETSAAETSGDGPDSTDLRDCANPDDALDEFARILATRAHIIRPGLLSSLRDCGVSDAQLVEATGLVARLAAVDTFSIAMGEEPTELPPVVGGEPTGNLDETADFEGGWLPTVGKAWPLNALSYLPDEDTAMHDVHDVLYLSYEGMHDLDGDRGLHRTQMELVAGRTSLLNECFF